MVYENQKIIASMYIWAASYCFSFLLLDEGLQLISKVNSTDLTAWQLKQIK